MKRFLKTCAVAFVLLLMCTFSAFAAENASDNTTWTLDADGTLTISCEGVCNGVPLTEEQWKQVKTIVFTEGVTEIGDCAFDHYWYTSVILPEGVVKIGYGAFSFAEKLSEIVLPSTLTEIGYGAFCCTGLTSVVIPEGVTRIEGAAFERCPLTSITFPETVTSIGEYAFQDCSLTAVTLPSSLRTLGHSAFAGCYLLALIVIPEGVCEIGSYAFCGCRNLTEITLPASLTYIGTSAFRSCSSELRVTLAEGSDSFCMVDDILFTKDQKTLVRYPAYKTETAYTVPSGVEEIYAEAFSNCKNLTEILLPEGLKAIGGKAFAGCENLKSITIPESVDELGEVTSHHGTSEFFGMGNYSVGPLGGSSLTEIVVYSRTANVIPVSPWVDSVFPKNATVYCYHYSATDRGARDVRFPELLPEFTLVYLDEDHEHAYTEEIMAAPTCTAEGEKVFTCSICGWTETETIAKLDHTIGEPQITPATCVYEGEKLYTCTGCTYSYTEKIPKTEHIYDEWDLSAISCVASEVSRKCHYCGRVQTMTLSGDLHTYGEWTETLAPTLQAAGEEQRVCTACGDVQTREVPKLALGEVAVPYVLAAGAVLVPVLAVLILKKKKK